MRWGGGDGAAVVVLLEFGGVSSPNGKKERRMEDSRTRPSSTRLSLPEPGEPGSLVALTLY